MGCSGIPCTGKIRSWTRRGACALMGKLWDGISTENLRERSDFEGYKREFLQLFGFEVDGVDYEADVDPNVPIRELA